jgi:hypothetical protein
MFHIYQEVLIASGPYLTYAAACQVVEGLLYLHRHLYCPLLV